MSRALAFVLRPWNIAAAIVLAVNDHVVKRAAPGWVSGKLSDVAGLFLLPSLVVALVALLRPRAPISRTMRWTTFAVGILFAAAKTLPLAMGLDVPWVPDPTDLVALAVLPLAWLHAVRSADVRHDFLVRVPALRFASVLLVAGATIATPQSMGIRRFPTWEVSRPSHAVGGAIVQAWVSRSTREGLGLSIDVACAPDAAPVSVDAQRTFLRLHHGHLAPIEVVSTKAESGAQARGYLAFEFDNLRAWNDGVRTAMLHLALRVGSGRRTLVLPLVHGRPSAHGKVPEEVQ